jgi:hypothetical protein
MRWLAAASPHTAHRSIDRSLARRDHGSRGWQVIRRVE